MDRVRVALSFALIFCLASIDSSIAPMVRELSAHFGAPMDQTLWLISACTAGIVAGVLLGPALISSFPAPRLLAASVAALAASHLLFLLAPGFGAALLWRAVFGLACGMTASLLWWLTFEGVSQAYYQAMVVVMMSARPLATAVGVPAAGLLASSAGWRPPFWALGGLMAAAGAALCMAMPADTAPKRSFAPAGVFSEYAEALRLPRAAAFYAGMTVNRMCYFGFYALTGIWFLRHYGLGLARISFALLVIGLAEGLVNFAAPALQRRWGLAATFTWGLAGSAVLLPMFLFGWLPLAAAVGLVAAFMLLDRVYVMAAVVSIRELFADSGSKTAFGSLNTLTAWLGLTFISWLEGRFTDAWGLAAMECVLLACFAAGSLLLYRALSLAAPRGARPPPAGGSGNPLSIFI